MKELLDRSKNIVICTHVNPDGDSIGSLTGMKGYLSTLGKSVCAAVPNNYPQFLEFLDPEKDYDLYDETGMVTEVKKGKDLYDKHYDRVESSVREHYEKLKNMPSEWLPHMDLKEVRKRG